MLWLQIIGLTISAFSGLQATRAANVQAKAQEKISARNAVVAEQDAKFAREAAGKREDEHRLKVARLKSSQKAKMASSGFAVGEGSFGDILEDTAALGELDALAIRHEGELESRRSLIRGQAASAQAEIFGSTRTSDVGTFGTLVTGLGSLET